MESLLSRYLESTSIILPLTTTSPISPTRSESFIKLSSKSLPNMTSGLFVFWYLGVNPFLSNPFLLKLFLSKLLLPCFLPFESLLLESSLPESALSHVVLPPPTNSVVSVFLATVLAANSISSLFSFAAMNLCLTVQSIPHLSLKIFSRILTSSSITLSFIGFFSTVISIYAPSKLTVALFRIKYSDIL